MSGRGKVSVTSEEKNGWTTFIAECSGCGWTYRNSVRSDVRQHATWHRNFCVIREHG